MFKNYLESTWISNTRALFKFSTWNHFNNLGPRTNNIAEGFHSKLNRIINRNEPKFYHVLESLIFIQFQMEVYYDRIQAGLPIKK